MDDAHEQSSDETPRSGLDPEYVHAPADSRDATSDLLEANDATYGVRERRSPRRRVLVSLIAVVIVAATSVVILTLGGSKSAAAAVIDAAHNAINAKTAFLGVNETITSASGTFTLSGTGAIDFANKATQIDGSETISGNHIPISVIFLAGTVFEQVPGISKLAPGMNWLSMNLSSVSNQSASSGAAALGNDPVATIYELAQQGATVVDLGSSSINGQTVEGYQVTFPPSLLQRQMQDSGLPAWMQGLVRSTSVNSDSETVYIANGKLIRLGVKASVTSSTTGLVTVNETADFNNFGATVSIAAPPANQVMTLQRFLQLATATSTSSSSTSTS